MDDDDEHERTHPQLFTFNQTKLGEVGYTEEMEMGTPGVSH